MGFIHVDGDNYIIEPLPDLDTLYEHLQLNAPSPADQRSRNNCKSKNETETHFKNLNLLRIKRHTLHKHFVKSHRLSPEHSSSSQSAHHILYKHRWSPNFSHSASLLRQQQPQQQQQQRGGTTANSACVQGKIKLFILVTWQAFYPRVKHLAFSLLLRHTLRNGIAWGRATQYHGSKFPVMRFTHRDFFVK